MNAQERLELALAHARAGREVFPFSLMPPDAGGRRAKVPKVKWTQEATTDESTIREWWRRWPLAMPGWRLPPGVVVLDVDDPARFEAAGLPVDLATASQQTPRGGYHLAFEHEAGREVRQTVKEVEGADTRVGGKGWVGLYETDSFARPMRPAPEFLYSPRAERQGEGEPAGEEMGTRDEILRWMGVLRRQRRSAAEILALLTVARDEGRIVALDEARPWTDADLRALAKEAGRWDPGPEDDGSRFLAGIDAWKARAQRKAADPTDERADGQPWFTPLADIDPSDPQPLELGFLDPEDHTILFGDGGTGKGMVAAWWVAQLSREGLVFVLDYEAHAKYEWRPRVARFGGDLRRVFIAQPGKPIWDLKTVVRDEIEEARVADPGAKVWLVVDSVGYACIGSAVEDSATAIRYSQAIAHVGLPTVSLAHTTKADADPQHPFGSVFWSNGARVTIGMTGTKQDPWRRLENKKTNQRGYFPTVELDWSWAILKDGQIPAGGLEWKVLDDSSGRDDGSDTRGAQRTVLEALNGAWPGGLTQAELVDLTGKTERTVKRVLNGEGSSKGLIYYKRVAVDRPADGGPWVYRAVHKEGFERQGGDEG